MELWEEASFQEWETHVRKAVIPVLENTAVTISLVPTGEIDVKFAVELGLSIMMDKPIIALVQPGGGIPRGLVAVAAEIVEVDLTHDVAAASKSIGEAVARVMHTNEKHISLEDAADDHPG